MKKILTLSFCSMIMIFSYSQDYKTVYLNKKWQPTKEKKARIIREISKVNDTLYKVNEFDNNRDTIMIGEYSSVEPMIENGRFVFFDTFSKSAQVSGQYKDGLMVGDWIYNKTNKVNYDLNLECSVDTSDLFVIVEKMPKFQDKDLNAFRQYVARNLVYPPRPVMQAISGRFFVQFTINKDGEVCNPEIVRGLNKDLEREALRVISQSPKWTPALQRGKPVNVQFTFPVIFILQ